MCLQAIPAGVMTGIKIATALAVVASSVATSVVSVQAANDQAAAATKAAKDAASIDYSIMQQREQQVNEQAALEINERQRQGLRERSRLIVAAGEAGVMGGSPLQEILNAQVQADYDTSIIDANRRNQITDAGLQKRGIEVAQNSRINQAQSSAYNAFTGTLKIGGDAVSSGASAYSWYRGLEA